MKRNWIKRINNIEKTTFSLCSEQLFEEWMAKNWGSQRPRDLLTVLDQVPQEFRLACLSRGLQEMHTVYAQEQTEKPSTTMNAIPFSN